ncbi:hypothetical protein INR75_19715 [Zunongwangia sp. SCSIO 43204]|uniref:hypothetical protein n=1 Tax=Zunongwangia sp. SCSIO 43204 TaxID=2779359 RepID=UPI001CA7D2C3|nr:hypothetical protein [Zunongwangia sp. SCSIO 43204]UAB84352.1 hypothetical protein INR75_19715 [Zunongwangia sp. SCSIO 43204]
MKRTRRLFKKDFAMKIQQDANGEELEFPDLEADDTPAEGDRIFIDGKQRESGERVMPSGETIVFKSGVITKIIESEEEGEERIDGESINHKTVARRFTTEDGKTLEIMGNNSTTPFRKGNRVQLNGKKISLGRYVVNGKKISVVNYRIASVETEKPKASRRLLKSSASNKKDTKPRMMLKQTEKFVWMRPLK